MNKQEATMKASSKRTTRHGLSAYLPVIVTGDKREVLYGDPLATAETARKYARLTISERNRRR